jgi:unsaturated rhamnogalacturonyl hydrolase
MRYTFVFLLISSSLFAQKNITAASDATAPLHALQADYPTPYGAAKPEEVLSVVNRVFNYLEVATPNHFVHKTTGAKWSPGQAFEDQTVFSKGDFRPISYEWGVTYSGMLELSRITGSPQYKDYVFNRLNLIASAIPAAQKNDAKHVLHGLIHPRALDDIGAMGMAVIKAKKAGFSTDMSFVTKRAFDFILKEEHRLPDRTLVRIRPLHHTMWLDDVYMAIPALLQLGEFDEAVFQFNSYRKRMFNPQLNIYMHGYLVNAEEHPEFHWARANGWALLTNCEMLEFLPANHPARPEILKQLKLHLKGLMSYQDGTGFWHQLIDKNDSYLETSATAIYTYVMAKGMNMGWLDPKTYGPAALLGWNAVATRVNVKGHVEGTCVGTGLAWDPAFYYHRPISPFAAHGYGPVLLAGSAIMELVKTKNYQINDSAVHLK